MRPDLDRGWTRTPPARAARELLVCGALDAVLRTYARVQVSGREHLAAVDAPAVFVANHCSHIDTPVLLRALPGPWRRRTAVAAAADYFYARRLLGDAVSLAFGTVPVERRGIAGTTGMRSLIDGGWSLVVFAEGTRSRDGRVGPLRAGAAALAAERRVPLVPVRIAGTHAMMPPGRRWPGRAKDGRHTIRVAFGPPIHVASREERHDVMESVRLFMQT